MHSVLASHVGGAIGEGSAFRDVVQAKPIECFARADTPAPEVRCLTIPFFLVIIFTNLVILISEIFGKKLPKNYQKLQNYQKRFWRRRRQNITRVGRRRRQLHKMRVGRGRDDAEYRGAGQDC